MFQGQYGNHQMLNNATGMMPIMPGGNNFGGTVDFQNGPGGHYGGGMV